jgi:hypothetical protein
VRLPLQSRVKVCAVVGEGLVEVAGFAIEFHPQLFNPCF